MCAVNSRVVALSDYRGTPRLRSAVEAFFSDKQLSANTRRAYRQALSAVAEDLGLDLSVDQLDSREVLDVFSQRWGSAQPATWNTRITALQSFVSYCQRNRWIDHDPMALVVRRREPRDQTRAIPYQDLEELWSRNETSTCGRRLCGGCCTKPPPGPVKSSRSTWRIWTFPANEP